METGVGTGGRQLELLDGMRCPHSWCNGLLHTDESQASCGTCERVIVRYE